MINIFAFYGTRPEFLKIYPLYSFIQKNKVSGINFRMVCTSQQIQLTAEIHKKFGYTPDHILKINNTGLINFFSEALIRCQKIINDEHINYVLVQGDTSTAAAAALAAFYSKIKIMHLEAGLRTHDLGSPFPEEGNRQLISRIAHVHFVPTKYDKENLKNENVTKNVYVVGNTIIDHLDIIVRKGAVSKTILKSLPKKYVVVTLHRRENTGATTDLIGKTIKHLARLYPEVTFINVVHPNKNISKPFIKALGISKNIVHIPPQQYEDFIPLLKNSLFIMSDSGGIQEEAATLQKKVILLRKNTERQLAVEKKIVFLSELKEGKILAYFDKLMKKNNASKITNPFGSGVSASKIVKLIKSKNEYWHSNYMV